MRHYLQSYSEGFSSELTRSSEWPASAREIRNAAKYLCRVEKSGLLPRGAFDQLMPYLMAFFLEHAARKKFSTFTRSANEKAFNLIYPGALRDE